MTKKTKKGKPQDLVFDDEKCTSNTYETQPQAVHGTRSCVSEWKANDICFVDLKVQGEMKEYRAIVAWIDEPKQDAYIRIGRHFRRVKISNLRRESNA